MQSNQFAGCLVRVSHPPRRHTFVQPSVAVPSASRGWWSSSTLLKTMYSPTAASKEHLLKIQIIFRYGDLAFPQLYWMKCLYKYAAYRLMHDFQHYVKRFRNATHRKRFPFDKNVAKKVENARVCSKQQEACCINPQVRRCRRRAGGIAVRSDCVALRNSSAMIIFIHHTNGR